MSPGDFAIQLRELFQGLAQGHAAGITVVTANRRLAHALKQDFDHQQAQRGLQAWETADVLPFNAFIERLWEDALYSEALSGLPLLLTPAQEQTLWEDVVRGSKLADALLSASGTASQCREAWQLAHAWRLMPKLSGVPANEDAHAFVEWSSRYGRLTGERRQTDAARLPDVLIPLLPQAGLHKPKTLVVYGFDTLTPQQKAVLDALTALGVDVMTMHADRTESQARRIEFNSVKNEVSAAARWARARLEAGDAQERRSSIG